LIPLSHLLSFCCFCCQFTFSNSNPSAFLLKVISFGPTWIIQTLPS
jgi:hypothetical protein